VTLRGGSVIGVGLFYHGGAIDVSGGAGGAGFGVESGFAGAPGQFLVVPEPTSWVLVGIGGLVLLGYSRWRHRGRATA
jgi:hypothetical protein